jgi:DUF2971 family protein
VGTTQQWTRRLAANFKRNAPEKSDWDHILDACALMATHDLTELSQMARSVPEAYRQQLELEGECGFLSLSERRDDLLMWAHYAEMHRGVCLEFDASMLRFPKQRRSCIRKLSLSLTF